MENFDVIIVGGGPIGLASAYECGVKEGKKVLVLERFQKFANVHGSSPGYSRQFRVSYSEYYLSDMALQTYNMWNDLQEEMNDYSILQETGCLWFGDSDVSSGEGNINKAIENLIALGEIENKDYKVYDGKEAIVNEPKFKFVSSAVESANVNNAKALFTSKGGTVSVPALVRSYVNAMTKKSNITLVNNARVTKIDHTNKEYVEVTAMVGGLEKIYHGDKVILTTGTYINEVLATLQPVKYEINLIIYLWCSTYFTRKIETPSVTDPAKWPIWYFFGPKPEEDGSDGPRDYNDYYGFPSEPNSPQYLRIAPAFTSHDEFNFVVSPPPIDQRPLDENAVIFTREFVEEFMPDLSPSRNTAEETTCIAGFAEVESDSGVADEGAGFVLDFLPNTERIVVFTGGWAMKFVPMIGKILTDLAIKGCTQYYDLIQPWNINRGVLKEVSPTLCRKSKPPKRSVDQNCKAFRKIWC